MLQTFDLNLPEQYQDAGHLVILELWWTGQWLRRYSRELFTRLGTSEAQFNVMAILAFNSEPVRQQDLCDRLLVERASMTGLVSRMESLGLIRRKAVKGDRRSLHVELTAEGKTRFDKYFAAYYQCIQGVIRHMSQRQIQQLSPLLEIVRNAVREGFAPPEKQ